MTNIIVIAAIAQNGVIGKKNDIPWRISEDFKRFQSLTMGYPCIMGDSTYKSLPDKSRPLPGRENIVLTLDKNYSPDGTTVFNDFNKSIDYVKNNGSERAFIIGGATIYKLGLAVANHLALTLIHKPFDGDIYFPEYNKDEWEIVYSVERLSIDRISNTEVPLSYTLYKRK